MRLVYRLQLCSLSRLSAFDRRRRSSSSLRRAEAIFVLWHASHASHASLVDVSSKRIFCILPREDGWTYVPYAKSVNESSQSRVRQSDILASRGGSLDLLVRSSLPAVPGTVPGWKPTSTGLVTSAPARREMWVGTDASSHRDDGNLDLDTVRISYGVVYLSEPALINQPSILFITFFLSQHRPWGALRVRMPQPVGGMPLVVSRLSIAANTTTLRRQPWALGVPSPGPP
jgi:hypothetical protein